MKLKIIAVLISINFVLTPLFCYANSDDFDCGINKTTDMSFNDTILFEDDSGQPGNLTTFDFVPLFNRSIVVPARKNVSALIRSFCNVCSGGYDLTGAILETYCEDNSNYSLAIKTENEFLAANSVNGSVVVTGIPNGEFSAHINNNGDEDLSCDTYLLGVGADTTPEEGYNINLTCYDKLPDGEKTNMWAWLGPVIGVGAALVGFGGYAGVQKAQGNNVLPEV